MRSQNNLPRRVRFGIFEADFRAGEVYRQGRKIKLQGQPFQVLSLLLEQPGEVVTREDLRSRIWPDDTFVDFDQGLNKAVLKIREALGDDATKPRFIETLPRRGYRLIVAVEPVQVADSPGNGNGHLTIAPGERAVAAGLYAAPAAPLAAEVPAKLPRSEAADHRLPRGAFMITAACLCLVVIAYGLRPSLPSPRIRGIVRLTNDRRPKFLPIVADSARLYFTEQIGSHFTPVALSTEGGDAVPIPAPVQDAQVLDISRDGSELLMKKFVVDTGEGPIWAVPVSGAPARRLGDLEAVEAVWSPDGQEILYHKFDDSHLFVAKSDGTNSRPLVSIPGSPYFIQWSPDGRRISVSVDDGKSNMLWEVSADGTNLHPVLAGWNFPRASCSGHWTSDGKYLLFDSYIGGPDNIWAIRERPDFFHKVTRQPVQLTTGTSDVGNPVPSDDGKRIYTMSEGERPQLSRYDSKSKTWKPFLDGISAENVAFSTDGQWVAYVSYPEAILFRSKIDGSQKLQLTIPPVQAAMPRISPDGKTVAYMARTLGKPWRIWLTPFAGGASRRLTSGTFEEVEPTWSPDGRSLAFSHNQSARSSHTIVLFDMATRRISSLPSLAMPLEPRWSPDGRYIAATDGSQKVVRFDLQTRKWEVLFKSPERHLYEPSWSQDGRSIYFVDISPNTPGHYRVRIRDRKIEKIVGSEGVSQVISGITSGWHGLTPDGSLLELHDEETPEIYALEWNAP